MMLDVSEEPAGRSQCKNVKTSKGTPAHGFQYGVCGVTGKRGRLPEAPADSKTSCEKTGPEEQLA